MPDPYPDEMVEYMLTHGLAREGGGCDVGPSCKQHGPGESLPSAPAHAVQPSAIEPAQCPRCDAPCLPGVPSGYCRNCADYLYERAANV